MTCLINATIPKRVVIKNSKINIVNLVLKVGTLAALVTYFGVARKYAKAVNIADAIKVTMRKNVNIKDNRKWIQFARKAFPFCTSPQDYDYWLDALGEGNYTDHTCITICPEEETRYGCLSVSEVAFESSFPPRVFATTYVMDKFMQRSGSKIETQQRPKTANYFVVSADLVGIGLQFDVDLTLPSHFGLANEGSTYAASSTEKKDRKLLTTMALDSKGNLWKTFQASPSIDLSMSELFFLSGHATLLNESHDLAGENKMPGGHPGGPSGRISGLELDVVIECYNPPEAYPKRLPPDANLVEGPACVLRVEKTNKAWTFHISEDNIGEYGLLKRSYHGVEIVARTGGSFEVADWNNIYLYFASMIVMIGVSNDLIALVAIRFLGHMSVIYSRKAHDTFDVLEEVAGMTTRMVVNSAAFAELEDVQDASGQHGGISRQRLAEQIKRLFESDPRVDACEVESIVRFCFRQVLSSDKRQARLSLKRLGQEFDLQTIKSTKDEIKDDTDFDRGIIEMERFCDACSNSESITVDMLLLLFDKQRPTTFLERLFTPQRLWNEIHCAKAKRDELPDPSFPSRCTGMESTSDTVHLHEDKGQSEATPPKATAGPPQDVQLDLLQQRLGKAEQSLQQLQRRMMDLEQSHSSSISSIQEIEERAALTLRRVDTLAAMLEVFSQQVSVSDEALTNAPRQEDVAAGSNESGESNGSEGRIEGLVSSMMRKVHSIEDTISRHQRTAQQLRAEHTALSERLGAVEWENELQTPGYMRQFQAELIILSERLGAIERSSGAGTNHDLNTVLG